MSEGDKFHEERKAGSGGWKWTGWGEGLFMAGWYEKASLRRWHVRRALDEGKEWTLRSASRASQAEGLRNAIREKQSAHVMLEALRAMLLWRETPWGGWGGPIRLFPANPASQRLSSRPHSPLGPAVLFLYFQFAWQAGEKWITSPWVSLFRTIKKSYFLVTRRMTAPRFPIFSPQGGCHHSILIDPTFHP